jgi:hypothetical protein
MASMNDITEPKRARVELERAHERFVTVIDGLDSAVHVADVNSGEILCQPGLSEHFRIRLCRTRFGPGHDPLPPGTGIAGQGATAHRSGRTSCELYDGEIQHALSGHWYHVHERAIRWVTGAPCASRLPLTSLTRSILRKSICSSKSASNKPRA